MALDTPQVLGSVSILGVAYPVYGSQDRAKEYANGSLNGSVFTGAAFNTQNQSLVMARRWIDRQSYTGEKTGGDSQFTQFPRDPDTTIPLGVEFAEYELAFVLIGEPDAFNEKNTGSNDKRLKAGPVEIEFFSRTDGSSSSSFGGAAVFPPQALDLIGPYLSSKSAILTPFVSGTENASNVLCVDDYDIAEPF